MQMRKTFQPGFGPGLVKWLLCLALFVPMSFLTACSEDSEGEGDPEPEPNSVRVSSTTTRMPSGGTLSTEFADSPAGCGIAQIVDNNNSK